MNERGTMTTVGIGGFLAWLSNLDLSSWSYIIGISVAVLSLAYGFYFSYRRNRREEELHRATLESLKNADKE